MIDGVPADGGDEVFDLAVFKRQTIAFLGDQTHDVESSTVVVALKCIIDKKIKCDRKKQTDKRVETLWMRWKMPDPITGAEKCKYGLFISRRPLFCPHISISFVHFYADVISPLFSDAEHGFMRC